MLVFHSPLQNGSRSDLGRSAQVGNYFTNEESQTKGFCLLIGLLAAGRAFSGKILSMSMKVTEWWHLV